MGGHKAHIYGNMVIHMKTTIDLPDDLLVEAKKRAAEERSTLRALFERALRRVLAKPPERDMGERRVLPIRWVTVEGGLPPGIDPSNRESMHEALRRDL